jgi:preprotein translocase subunit SecA
MRLFGADNVAAMVDRLGLGEDEPVESGLLTKAIETAQKRVEARNFSIREHVLQYDDVMNRQRETIYEQRRKVLRGEDLRESVRAMIERVVDYVVDTYTPDGIHPDEWDIPGLINHTQSEYIPEGLPAEGMLLGKDKKQVQATMRASALKAYEARETYVGPDTMRQIERAVLLRVVDMKWMDHLKGIDDLREGIGLRAYGQRDPLIEYTKEAHELFSEMIDSIEQEAVKWLFHIQVAPEVKRHAAAAPTTKGAEPRVQKKKPGRNDPCPCGSGKKYKNCCGKGE